MIHVIYDARCPVCVRAIQLVSYREETLRTGLCSVSDTLALHPPIRCHAVKREDWWSVTHRAASRLARGRGSVARQWPHGLLEFCGHLLLLLLLQAWQPLNDRPRLRRGSWPRLEVHESADGNSYGNGDYSSKRGSTGQHGY